MCGGEPLLDESWPPHERGYAHEAWSHARSIYTGREAGMSPNTADAEELIVTNSG